MIRFVHEHGGAARRARHEVVQHAVRDERTGGVVGVAHEHEAHGVGDTALHRDEIVLVVTVERHAMHGEPHVLRVVGQRLEGGRGRHDVGALDAMRERRDAQHLARSLRDHDVIHRHVVLFGERGLQDVECQTAVLVVFVIRIEHGLLGARRHAERILVGGQPYHARGATFGGHRVGVLLEISAGAGEHVEGARGRQCGRKQGTGAKAKRRGSEPGTARDGRRHERATSSGRESRRERELSGSRSSNVRPTTLLALPPLAFDL